jgi:hypothetical protein
VLATWPAVLHLGSHFLAGGAPGYGEAAPGDHLQTSYRLWLFGHQLGHGHAPWLDPYTFRPESPPVVNFEAWPFGIPYWPLTALGPVLAWNVFVLLTYVAAGLLTFAWLRELGLGRGPALAGGLVFAIAPYRAIQSAGHLLGPISLLLPLALWAFERGRRRGSPAWLGVSVAAIASIPLSGQVHLALGAIPFFCLYALCRSRARPALLTVAAVVVAGAAAGLLVQHVSISGSISAGGRSLGSVGFYSAEPLDFVTRHERHGSESFVFLGWLAPLLAIAGLAVLIRERRRGLAWALGLGALAPILLALGTHLPSYSWLWHHVEPFRYPRVPERLLPIACLALAGLVAFALSRARVAWLVPIAIVLLALDLHVRVYGASAADPANAAYAAIGVPGRLLEVPVFLPEAHYGSVYMYYDQQARRERPGGYSTVAPHAADTLARDLQRLNCGDWTGVAPLLRQLGVTAIAFHRGLFVRNIDVPDRAYFAWRGLDSAGWAPTRSDGGVTLFRPGTARAVLAPPAGTGPLFCEGWFRPTDAGATKTMSATHAPLWVRGPATVEFRAISPAATEATVAVDGRRAASRATPFGLRLPLRAGWHLVTFDIPHLAPVGRRREGLTVSFRRMG